MEKHPKKILLVDDDKDLVQSIEELLKSEDYQVIKAHDGKSGLQLAIQERPDLMILDVMMAYDTEGLEISREIRKHPDLKGLPVILLTGITSEKTLPFKFEPDENWLPVDVVLEKPVNPQILLQRIKTRLA
jgi:DNA-binding response OmpR family regulator